MFLANWLVLKLPFSTPINIALFAVSYFTPPAVFFVLDWALRIDRLSIDLSRAWRILVVGSVIFAVLNSLVINLIVQQVALPNITAASILGLIISDMLGLITVLVILIAVFRAIHFLRKKPPDNTKLAPPVPYCAIVQILWCDRLNELILRLQQRLPL